MEIEMEITEESESTPSLPTTVDLPVVRLWRNTQQTVCRFWSLKQIQMYLPLLCILFLGTICSMTNMIGQTLKLQSFLHRDIPLDPKSLDPITTHSSTGEHEASSIANATIDVMDLSGVNASAPPPIEMKNLVYHQNESVTWHQLSDEELRKRATKVPQKSTRSAVAFMYITKGPMPFAPLWERYFRGNDEWFNIYVHAHPNFVPSFMPSSPFFGRFIPSQVAEWGKVSLQEAENRLLFNALLDYTNNWFVLLSESCIPVVNFPVTYKYITQSQENFIMAFQESSDLRRTRLYRNKHKEMAPEVTVKNFRKGSQWFQISRDLAFLVPNDAILYTKFVKYFCKPNPICYIDEHYLPTLFSISSPKSLASRTLMYFEFARNHPHPKKWDGTNTNLSLIKFIREGHSCRYNGNVTSNCFVFARKFNPNALPLLLELAHDIMGIP